MTDLATDYSRTPLKPIWTSGSFLLYTGGLTVLGAALWSLGYLSGRYGDAAYAGWSALIFVVLAAIAFGLRGPGRWIAAGIFAFSAVVAFILFVAALEKWWGWFPDNRSGAFRGFDLAVLFLELVALVAALVLLGLFRFPLLVAIVAAAAWYFVTDLVSGGGNWSAVVTFLVGAFFLLVAVALDRTSRRPYGFWLHVTAGLLVGGSLIFLMHKGDTDWALIAVASLAYVALAAATGRSSWAVLGALGLFLSGGHFAAEWAGNGFSFLSSEVTSTHDWAPAAVFAFVGFLILGLGLLFGRGRRVVSTPL